MTTRPGGGAAFQVAFAGTPAFAAAALQAVLDAGFGVPLVLTQPDRPAGRGLKAQASAVKRLALAHGLPVQQPAGLRLDGRFAADAISAQQALRTAAPAVLVVAAYGLILPPWALALPVHGSLNVHGSLLPRWRGAAPVQRAIEAGDTGSGITIMQMDAGLDTGALLLAEPEPIGPDDTAATLHDRLAALGARLIVQALEHMQAGTLVATPQPAEGATYAAKIDKAEAAIDWAAPAAVIERRLRAFDPFPGCTALLFGQPVKLWRGAVVDRADPGATPGTTRLGADGGVQVACGEQALEVLELQRAGGRRIGVADFVAALPPSLRRLA